MTRLGEALFRYRMLRGFEKFLHGPGDKIRRSLINSIGSVSVKQFGLDKLGLIPRGTMEGIVRGAIGLATEGFFEGVEAGTIRVRRDRTIARLYADGKQRYAELDDGTVIPADIIVCATGFQQSVPFLDANVQAKLHDDRGNFALYGRSSRRTSPVSISTATTRRSSARSTRNSRHCGSPRASRENSSSPASTPGASRSPGSLNSWTTRSVRTIAEARRSSRSRCTTPTRCSPISIFRSAF
ncbi:hypothetical protein [Amycolatopsis methanolica]|uniref:hypothetical protein n=1 Tax=Amycolatopsis methanolica TaxID=1814 RepID=UPI003420691E